MGDQAESTFRPGAGTGSPADVFVTVLSGKSGKSVGRSRPVLLSDGTLVAATTVVS